MSAAVAVFYLSSLSLTTEFSPNWGHQTVLEGSHNSDQPELKLINPTSSKVKGDTDPDDRVIVEALGSTGDHGRDYVVGVSEEVANQGDDESDSDSDSQESATDSGPESAAGAIASHAWTPKRHQYSPPTESSARMLGFLQSL